MARNSASDDSDDDAYDETSKEVDAPNGKGSRLAAKQDDGPACQACRRKKAKCSRRMPCSHCARYNLECIYDEKKAKPGMRTGAIETLSQRVATLENMFLGQGLMWQQVWRCLDKLSGPHDPALIRDSSPSSDTLQECTAQLKRSLSALQPSGCHDNNAADDSAHQRKRHKADNADLQDQHQPELPSSTQHGIDVTNLPDDLVDALVDIYFVRVHPWIPILHVRRFREEARQPSKRPRLQTVFLAIVSLCVRFSDDLRLGDHGMRSKLAESCRQAVILESMQSFSVENLQALVICAFDTIGSGRGPSAWSIIGSMARTVEQLQLSVEEEDIRHSTRASKVLIQRMAFLRPCHDWVEVEGRRRVFWNVFLMDRFCSIATGWNPSLKSAEVRRRLPCEGAFWETGEPLPIPTPYFGVSDQSNHTNGTLPDTRPAGSEDPGSLGGFAYCIEATESLSLVTNFFLHQVVDVGSIHDIQLWLVRFKQLDLRLVQWKIFLPERWREACALNADGNMDPNLTLAHITHNTAVVLLHQGIAYPSSDWQASPIRLPSTPSAETCLAAAKEVAIIVDSFLQGADFLTNPQFAFCLFICGRMLLAHSAYYNIDLPGEFDILVNSLHEISRRWNGPYAAGDESKPRDNLASKFAYRLSQARYQGPNTLDIRHPAYSEAQDQDTSLETSSSAARANQGSRVLAEFSDVSATHHQIQNHNNSHTNGNSRDDTGLYSMLMDQEASPDSISLAFPPLPMAFQVPSALQTPMLSPRLGPLQGFRHEASLHLADGVTGFEHLNSLLNYPILPDQRVSMFSQPAVGDTTGANEDQQL